jgi:tetratricopeptide (TPR) repeat protein
LKAVQCYRRALAVYRRSAWPEQHAALQNNLGNAFLSLPESGERVPGRNAVRALRHFERALRLQPDTRSRAFAITQYNCAQARFRLARCSPAMDTRLAVCCLEAAAQAFEACGDARYAERVHSQLQRICRATA